jgi:hypothetical protein
VARICREFSLGGHLGYEKSPSFPTEVKEVGASLLLVRPQPAGGQPGDACAPSPLLPEEPDLPQHGGVVPVDPLTGELISAELHDHHEINLDLLVRRRGVREEPRHGFAVRECDVEFIHQLARPNDPVDGHHLDIVRP